MALEESETRRNFTRKLQTMFQEFFHNWVLSEEMNDQEIIDKYFSLNFSACIDGVELSRNDFLHRVHRMRQEVAVERLDFIEMMEEDSKLFSMHTISGKSLLSEQHFQTHAIAFFIFKDDKIEKGYLNSATRGNPQDFDIASRS